jgi:hypothetical protein
VRNPCEKDEWMDPDGGSLSNRGLVEIRIYHEDTKARRREKQVIESMSESPSLLSSGNPE